MYRFRLDKTISLAGETNLQRRWVYRLRLEAGYLSIDQQNLIDSQDPQDDFRDREEITPDIRSKFTGRWGIGASTRRDLTTGGGASGMEPSYPTRTV